MGTTLRVTGFVSTENETYKKQAKVLIACVEAGISNLPKETAEYFGSEYPEMWLLEDKLAKEIPLKKWVSDDAYGYEILVSEIPHDVYKIRFGEYF